MAPLAFALVVLSTALAPIASAQGTTWTGYELALEGSPSVRADRTARVRGTAYRVRGLAELVPFAGRVRARFAWVDVTQPAQAFADVQVDGEGRFVAEIPIPPRVPDHAARLEFEVGPQGEARTFEIPVRVQPGLSVRLYTDRVLYEPGEDVHVWALVRDTSSRRPITGQSLVVGVEGSAMPATTHTLETGASGVAHLVLPVPEDAAEAEQQLTVRVPGQLTAQARFRVGTRTYERLFARVEVEPEPVVPGAEATVRVHLTTTSGAPVRDARAVATVDGERSYSATTDATGTAQFTVRAPVYMIHDTGAVSVRVELSHPAHGAMRAVGTMRLAVPLALTVEAQPRHGAIVPEIDDVLFVHVHDALGDPPTQPTEITVEGPAIRGGRATATTDANGFCELPLRLPLGAASTFGGREPRTSVVAHIAGPLERTARLSLDVSRDATVAPIADAPIVAPGASVSVSLARRPSARRQPVVVELVDAHEQRLVVRWLAAGEGRTSIDVPADFVGLATLRARPVLSGESLEGTGAATTILVRPADPGFLRVEPTRERWTVGETARVRLRTGSGGPRRFAAVLVRDLAAHGGERPFIDRFLAGRFEDVLRSPSDEAGVRLAAAAMASVTDADRAPTTVRALVDRLGLPSDTTSNATARRRSLRDPWPLARELARRGIAPAMVELESRLAEALDDGALDEVTTSSGGQRRLRDDLLADEDDTRTLGDGRLTASILEAADPSFTYDRIATRVARRRLVKLLVALARYLDPGDEASPAARMAAREPSARWLPRMVERGVLGPHDLDDPWGNRFVLRSTRRPALVVSARATELELVSPGPDGRVGTRDDVRDPFARAVPAATAYAVASGEDALMRRLAVLSPTEQTLQLIRESYRRVSAEMTEEEIGDAVSAEVSEGTIGLGSLGTIGHGGGSGSGSGYGSGGLGLRGTGRGGGGTGQGTIGLGSLAAIVRERFPPTLLFRPSVDVDPSGVTEIEIPLADAVTTYLVEAIVWREDGWSWSESARIEVDRDVVVDAPVPELGHRGDVVRLPLRVANRGDAPRELMVQLVGDEGLGIPSTEATRVTVPAGDAVVVPVELTLARVGEGELSAVVADANGEPIDAVRRPIRVVAPGRRVTRTQLALSRGDGRLQIEVPQGADPRGATVEVQVGPALFGADDDTRWSTWAGPGATPASDVNRGIYSARRDPTRLAFAIGRGWGDARVPEQRLHDSLEWLTRDLDRLGRREEQAPELSRARAWALLGLAPAYDARHDRDVPAMRALLDRLREEVAADALAQADDPELSVVAAAALGWTQQEGDEGQALELARRLERNAIDVGEDRWLATEQRAVRSTVLYAMVELARGQRGAAFRLLGTVARWASRDHDLQPDERGLARAAMRRLTEGDPPAEATVRIDGQPTSVRLVDGAGTVASDALATPGVHRVEIEAGGAPALVTVESRFALPWDRPPAERGPFRVHFEGDVGAQDETSELELTIENRNPRTIRRPVIEISIPTGAELTERQRQRMGARVERGGGVLTIHLPPMRPGNTRTIPIPLRWGVAGRLRGLGVSAYAPDRPQAVTVLQPRELEIAAAGEEVAE